MSFTAAISAATDQAFAATPQAFALDLEIAGIAIQLQATDADLLAAFSASLKHHRTPISTPHAVIRLWSAAKTAIQRPDMPEAIRQRVVSRCADLAPDETCHLDFDPAGRMVSVIDPTAVRVDVCLSSIQNLPHWEHAAPLRNALGWILRQQDRHLLHAAAVGEAGGCALLLGEGGAGKSTAALRCHQAGMDFLGDDICVVQAGLTAHVFNIYGNAKTVWSDLEHFAAFQPLLISKPGSLKAVYALNQASTNRITNMGPIRVLLLLDRSLPVGNVRQANPGRAVAIAASTTASFLPGSGRPMLSALADIARRLPVLRISLGEDPQRVAALVSRAIREPLQMLQESHGD